MWVLTGLPLVACGLKSGQAPHFLTCDFSRDLNALKTFEVNYILLCSWALWDNFSIIFYHSIKYLFRNWLTWKKECRKNFITNLNGGLSLFAKVALFFCLIFDLNFLSKFSQHVNSSYEKIPFFLVLLWEFSMQFWAGTIARHN